MLASSNTHPDHHRESIGRKLRSSSIGNGRSPSAPPASDNTMNGAQPTVPADSFDSRWGGSQ
jgi:hypothetical protein